ncbi:MAG: hypothetical protein KC503_25810 [Myxococcales bacterium]|nr:hypothetical protein [Myxococcales bacterium]
MRVFGLCVPLLALWLLPACGSGDLSRDTVTNLPAGDATGTARGGRYDLTVRTLSCSGQCPTFQVAIFTIRICEVGNVDNQTVDATQNDGELVVSGDAGLYVDAMRGGVWQDGRFDVGGYANEQGVDITARVEGTIAADGTISARARVYGSGTVSGTSVSCNGSYDITGARQ